VYLEGIGVDRLTSDLWPLAVTAVLTLSIGGWGVQPTLGVKKRTHDLAIIVRTFRLH